jgi:hypothetical protein
LQHAGVEEQAAVAVLGQAGQGVQPIDLHAGPFKGLEQRVGEPLRQLVEGHPALAGAGVGIAGRRVPPAVAQRDVAQVFCAGQMDDRLVSRMDSNSCASMALLPGSASASNRCPGPAARAEQRGLVLQGLAQAAQQRGAAFKADQRVVRRDLEGGGQLVGRDGLEAGGIGLQGYCESLENMPAVNA